MNYICPRCLKPATDCHQKCTCGAYTKVVCEKLGCGKPATAHINAMGYTASVCADHARGETVGYAYEG